MIEPTNLLRHSLRNADITSSLDKNGIFLLPNRFRSLIGDRIVIFYQGLPGVLRVMNLSEYDEYAMLYKKMFSVTNNDGKFYRQLVVSNAHEVSIDSSDRIMIPAELRQASGIGAGKIYLISNDVDGCSIYSESAYKEFNDNPAGFRAEQREKEELLFEKAVLREQKIQSLMGGLKS